MPAIKQIELKNGSKIRKLEIPKHLKYRLFEGQILNVQALAQSFENQTIIQIFCPDFKWFLTK